MKSTDIMVEEHENIRRMSKVIRKYSYKVLKDEKIDYNDFYKIIDFIRNYSDGHHHSKEEDVLFKVLAKEAPKLPSNGAISGMLIEHDLSRLHVSNLETALKKYEAGEDEQRLDIIANAISYTDLLDRHTEKEDKGMYNFANNILKDDIKKKIDKDSEKIDLIAEEKGIQKKYLDLLNELEEKIG